MKTFLTFSIFLLSSAWCSAQWEPDVRLTNNTAQSKAAVPSTYGIACQGDTLHVTWYDNRDGNTEIYYKRSTDGGDAWGPDTRLTNATGVSEWPSISVSGADIHVSWEDTRDGSREIYYKHSPDGGQSWGADTRITYANFTAWGSAIAANGSNLHLVWVDQRDGNDEIYYTHSTDGGTTWQSQVRLSNDAGYSGLPSIALSGSTVHVAWEDERGNGEIYYRRSGDGGLTWEPETNLTNNTLQTWDPSIAVSGSIVHCVYQEDVLTGDYDIFYKRSINSGMTWEDPVRLSNNTAASTYPNIAVNGQVAHVVWMDARDGQTEIYYNKSVNAGAAWQLQETRLTNNAGISEMASACASPAATYVVWDDTRNGNYEIYYKRCLNSLPPSTYYERLFYLCKAWGHAKYHHTEIAAGNINWDDELFKAIQGAKNSPTTEGFNDSLQLILDLCGPMGFNPDTLPYVPDSLNNILDYSWIQDEIFSDTVRSLLDTILARFGPQYNAYVGEAWSGGNPTFDNDQQYYLESGYPPEEKRILAMFRYWNIFNYFAPYKNLIDQDWDTTLVEFIPKIVEATDALSFNLAFKELTTRINDSHGYCYSPVILNWRGTSYPPFMVRFVENEMVVTQVLDGISDISPGDVIKAIDGEDIYVLRDSLRKYAHGSNDVIIERELNNIIMWGPSGNSEVVLDDGTMLDTATFSRNSTNYNNLQVDNSPIWYDTLVNGSCHFGIVDMERLTSGFVNDMFYELWETDAIIFDIRNFPQGTLWDIVNYIYPGPIDIANFTVPDITYPGALYWSYVSIGSGTSDPYSGNIMMLFDERTQSRAEYTCMGLEQFPGALKIGSTTSAADGNVSRVYLPGYIYTYFTGLGTFYPDYTPTQRVGIIPDYELHPTIAGIRAGIDEVLAFALDCSLLDMKELSKIDDFKVYPNPSLDKLYYEIPGITDRLIQFEIIDIFGRIVDRVDRHSGNGELDLSHLTGGTYFLKVNTGKEILVKKVLKL